MTSVNRPERRPYRTSVIRRLDASAALFCRRWGVTGHNEITVRGTVLFWRRYAVCCACGNERRVR